MGEAELSPEIERLAKKLEKDPSSRVFAQLGDLYRKAKLYDEAIQVLSSGLEQNPNYALGHLVLAKTYLDQMRSAMAKEELEKVIELDPQNIVALRLLSPIVEKGGSDQDLTRIYELILAVDPSDQQTLEKLNNLKKRQSEKKEVPTGEFRVETFQRFQPPEEKGETMEEVKSDLVEQMTVEPLRKDLPEEKVEIEPYVERPGSDVKSSEEIKIERDASFTPTKEPVPEEKIDVQSDLMSQMGVEPEKKEGEVVEEKIDTDIMGQLTGETIKKEEEDVSSIEDVLKVTTPEDVPTVDEILAEPEAKPEEKEEKKDNLQSFRDWLDSLSK